MDHKIKPFIAMLFATFICYAFFTILFGSQAVLMMDYYNISETGQGLLTTMLSIGGIASAFICALYGERFPKLKTLGLGLALLAVVTVLIGFALPYTAVLVCALFAGLAYTVMDIMVNSSLTQYFPNRSKTLLPMAHMFFGVGAMAGPYLMTAIVNPDIASSFTLPFILVGLLTAVVFVIYSISAKKVSNQINMISPKTEQYKPTEVFSSGKFWILLASGILYCCFTTGILAWFPTYFNETKGLSLDMAGLMLTLFFAGSLAMRFLGPFFFSKLKPQKIFILFSLLSALFMVLALLSGSIPLIILFTVLSGAFQALNMPAIIFIGCALFPQRHASATSIAIFSYNIGGIFAPVLLGQIAKQTGFQLPMLLCCGLSPGLCRKGCWVRMSHSIT